MAKYRDRLSPAETGLYDLMRKSSEILRELADEIITDVPAEQGARADNRDYMHDAVTYAFTLGVQFAVNRQQEVARQVAKKMGLIEEPN